MWFRLRLDIQYSDLSYALLRCLRPGGRAEVVRELNRLWAGPDQTLTCLSVRTGLELLLQALAFPPGSEILITALTIPDMVKIIRHHQLVPVPLDIHPGTLAPDITAIQRSLTPRTKALIVTHLFGTRIPIEPILDAIRPSRILLLEDCAQAFEGPQDQGHPAADVSMFSFGPIKTSTALGGGLLRVKDRALCRQLQELEAHLPMQPRTRFARRALKYLVLKMATNPRAWGAVAWACRKRGLEYDPVVTRLARGFAGQEHLITQLRHRPSTPLLALLRRRLARFDAVALEQREHNGRTLAHLIGADFILPGSAAGHHSYWLFPLLSARRLDLIAWLRDQGFDAAQHHTLAAVPAPAQTIGGNRQAHDLLQQLLFVPANADLPVEEIKRLAECLRAYAATELATGGVQSLLPSA
jgi:dTDP-4-amino-4,6-dideoxygalactose transaminase